MIEQVRNFSQKFFVNYTGSSEKFSEVNIGVRIDIWIHLMRGCIMKLCTLT